MGGHTMTTVHFHGTTVRPCVSVQTLQTLHQTLVGLEPGFIWQYGNIWPYLQRTATLIIVLSGTSTPMLVKNYERRKHAAQGVHRTKTMHTVSARLIQLICQLNCQFLTYHQVGSFELRGVVQIQASLHNSHFGALG